jgi:eukaryotic-like serine/threonine-protein kinase
MIDLAALQVAFPEVSTIQLIQTVSGQKHVFRVSHAGAPAVLKIVKKGLVDLARVQREIEAVQRLNSAYVPQIISSGLRKVAADDQVFILERFIEGHSYREKLRAMAVQNVADVIVLVDALLQACRDFEAAKIVHRDIKPENLMIGNDGKVWVIDFGIVRHLDLQSLTADGLYGGIGTLGYAAPEQFQNIKAEINVRADLFGVGVVTYEALSGYNPYLRGLHSPQAVVRRMETEVIPVLSIPGDTSGIFGKFIASLIQRFPSRRPQTASEAIQWFESVKQQYP